MEATLHAAECFSVKMNERFWEHQGWSGYMEEVAAEMTLIFKDMKLTPRWFEGTERGSRWSHCREGGTCEEYRGEEEKDFEC